MKRKDGGWMLKNGAWFRDRADAVAAEARENPVRGISEEAARQRYLATYLSKRQKQRMTKAWAAQEEALRKSGSRYRPTGRRFTVDDLYSET